MDHDDLRALRQDLAAWARTLTPTERQSKLRCVEWQLAILRQHDARRCDADAEPARPTQEDAT